MGKYSGYNIGTDIKALAFWMAPCLNKHTPENMENMHIPKISNSIKTLIDRLRAITRICPLITDTQTNT